jgi:hypothetical protein
VCTSFYKRDFISEVVVSCWWIIKALYHASRTAGFVSVIRYPSPVCGSPSKLGTHAPYLLESVIELILYLWLIYEPFHSIGKATTQRFPVLPFFPSRRIYYDLYDDLAVTFDQRHRVRRGGGLPTTRMDGWRLTPLLIPSLLRAMKVLILQLDGKIPNLACMRLAAHHRALGHEIAFRWGVSPRRELWDSFDTVYASAIFEKTRPAVEALKREFPHAIVGGTGVDVTLKLEEVGITSLSQDYSIYPAWRQSIGFSQRGCRLRCSFCVVPRKEGKIRPERTINEIWRGDPWPRELILLDNDFLGQPEWEARINELMEGRFRVSFCQGINVRVLTDETAAAIASVDYRADDMKSKRIYTAWDSTKDQDRLFKGLQRLVDHGVLPDHLMVYMLIGYWPGETEGDWLHRQSALRLRSQALPDAL